MLPKAVRMLRRAEFVQASRAARGIATPCFVIQSVPDSARNLSRTNSRLVLGITASRKVGNAVVRNRAKRRLRALLYQVFVKEQTSHPAPSSSRSPSPSPSPSRRIVLIARRACLDADFTTMRQQLKQALIRNKAQGS